jgi:hypothetical protein
MAASIPRAQNERTFVRIGVGSIVPLAMELGPTRSAVGLRDSEKIPAPTSWNQMKHNKPGFDLRELAASLAKV